MSNLFLSVGVCVYNKEKEIPNALQSLAEQTISKDLFEIIVVDNNSTDNTEAVVKEFINNHPELNIKYFKEINQGVSYARNRCYKEASGNYIVYFDDDEIAFKDWLQNFYDSIKKHPEAVILAGKVIVKYEDPEFAKIADSYIDNWFANYEYGDEEIVLSKELIEKGKIDYPIAGNMAVKMDYIKEVNGFDTDLGRSENLMLGGEETKFTKDALENGKIAIYTPQSTIHHIVIKNRCSIDFLKMKHFQQGMTFIRIYFNGVSLFKRLKIVIYHIILILAKSVQYLFSSNKERNFIAMKNCFAKGIIYQCLHK